jgi:hypothetical protein
MLIDIVVSDVCISMMRTMSGEPGL